MLICYRRRESHIDGVQVKQDADDALMTAKLAPSSSGTRHSVGNWGGALLLFFLRVLQLSVTSTEEYLLSIYQLACRSLGVCCGSGPRESLLRVYAILPCHSRNSPVPPPATAAAAFLPFRAPADCARLGMALSSSACLTPVVVCDGTVNTFRPGNTQPTREAPAFARSNSNLGLFLILKRASVLSPTVILS